MQNSLPFENHVDSWCRNHASANIAIVTGKLSNITVIDCDDKTRDLNSLLEEFGETPLIATTPRGGYHLYYAFNGEHKQTAYKQNIDILGEGGFIIAPPSFSPKHNRCYSFIAGDLTDITNLPKSKLIQINQGRRNQSLFYYLKEQAVSIETFEELLDSALMFNQECAPPDYESNVKSTAKKIWQYKQEDRLFNQSQRFLTLEQSKVASIQFNYPLAFAIYAHLRLNHASHSTPFAISPNAYGRSIGKSPKTVRKCIHLLLKYNLIKQIHRGGKRPKDPHLYILV